MQTIWTCPHCGAPLTAAASGGLRCSKNHSFDIAKEGYCNLLPVQGKKAKSPGDSKEMVAARRAFLNAGYYQMFGDALAALCLQYGNTIAHNRPLHLLDAGCGEGWYDRAILSAFAEGNTPVQLAGFDISKEAVRLAAKAAPQGQYAVASSFAQPVPDGWADVLLNIFSPLALEQFTRVLGSGGVLVYAVPGARHLFGMKQTLYQTPYENKQEQPQYEGFALLERRSVCGEITVPQTMLHNLFAMTPYYWNTPRDGAARLAALPQLTTEIAFDFLVFQKI